MRRQRRASQSGLTINLFPFLAVLICTMGSLIVLLVIMVQHARVRAATSTHADSVASTGDSLPSEHVSLEEIVAKRRAEHEAQLKRAEEAAESVEHYRWQASLLQESYNKTVQDLAHQRLALSHLESHTRELSHQASQLQAEADLIAKSAELKLDDQQANAEKLSLLKERIAQSEAEIAKMRAQLQSAPTTYALVPYDGPNGTTRMPIYIECLADRVILQPEGITFDSADFEEPLEATNPISAALRAKREFLIDNQVLSPGQEPYPLLVVRPHAAASYAAARSAMRSWEAEFGYELLEDDVQLDYPASDSRLTQLLEDVVAESRERRRFVRMVADSESRRSAGTVLRPARDGGFEVVGGHSNFESDSTSGEANRRASASGRNGDRNTERDPYHGRNGADSSGHGSSGAGPDGSANKIASQQNGRRETGSASRGSANTKQDGGWSEEEPSRFGQSNPLSGDSIARAEGAMGRRDGNQPSQGGQHNSSNSPTGLHRSGSPSDTARTGPTEARASADQTANAGSARGASGPQASGASGPQAGGAPGPTAGNAMSMGTSTEMQPSLAQARGSNWANPHAVPEAVGIKRPIQIVCEPTQIVLVPERGSAQRLQLFKHSGAVAEVIDPFVNSVQARLHGWGIAGTGIFWLPILQVEVKSGADDSFEQLAQLLNDSGIKVVRQP